MKQSILMFAALVVIMSFGLTSCNKEEIVNPTGEITEETDKTAEIMAFVNAYNNHAKFITTASKEYTTSQLKDIQTQLNTSNFSEFQSIMQHNFGVPTNTWASLKDFRSDILNQNESDKIIGAIVAYQIKDLVKYETVNISHLANHKLLPNTRCASIALNGTQEAILLAIGTEHGVIKATIRYLDLLKEVAESDC